MYTPTCLRKDKQCRCVLEYHTDKKKNFICSGIYKNPPIYKKDNIKLCVKSALLNLQLLMTKEEAAYISSVLSGSVGFLMPGIPLKDKSKLKE